MSVTNKNNRPRQTTAKTYLRLLSFLILFLLLQGQNLSLAGNNAALIWTAPGDDFLTGQAFRYDIRYSSEPIGSDTTNWWDLAQKVASVPFPSPVGLKDSCIIPNLSIEEHIYIAIRTTDEAYNWSDISNIAEIPKSFCIDLTQDGTIDILDIIYLLDCIYKDGPAIPQGTISDVDNSGRTDIIDAIYLINYCYKGGPAPVC